MHYIEDLSDERLRSACTHCGGIGGASTDHVPTKALLQKPYPAHLPTIAICETCNASFSKDEEYLFLFLQCVLVGSTDPNRHTNHKAARALQHNPKLRAMIEQSKVKQMALWGKSPLLWRPDITRINRIILKNARGHVLYECGTPIWEPPEGIWGAPLTAMSESQRTEFENGRTGLALWPEAGSRMMTRIVTGADMKDGWIIVQEGIYRYRVECDGALVNSVIYEYLATEVHWDYDC